MRTVARYFLYACSALLLFAASPLWAQKDKIVCKVLDFNSDGAKDSITFYYDGGSGFGGHTAEVYDGKSRRRFNMTSYHSFASFFTIIPVDDFFWMPENKKYRYFLQKIFASDAVLNKDDGSLQWLISAYLANPQPFSGSKPLKSTIRWADTFEPQRSSSLYVISNDSLKAIINHNISASREEESANGSEPLDKPGKGWLIYYGNSHYQSGSYEERFPKAVQGKGQDSLYITKHGVLIKKANRYAWLASHDCGIFGGPDKLRYSSILKAIWEGDYVYFDHHAPMDAMITVYRVSLKTGEIRRVSSKGSVKGVELSVKKNKLELVYTGMDGEKTVDELNL